MKPHMRAIRWMLTLAGGLAGAAIFGKCLIATARSPMAVEGIFAVAVLALVLTGMRPAAPDPAPRHWMPAAAGLIFVALMFLGATRVYFLCDDFFIVQDALWGRGRDFLAALLPQPHGIFCRPVSYWLHWRAATFFKAAPAPWHFYVLAVHLANCVLVYAVAARLRLSGWGAVLAAVLFGIHGTRPESAVWIAGAYELESAFFFLASLWLYLRGRRAGYAAALVCSLAAIWCKESAYVLPFFLLLLPRRDGETWPRRLRSAAPFFALAGLAFLHRWLTLGGVGGYPGVTASPFRVAELLFFRLWAVLFFPIDWMVQPGPVLALATGAAAAALLYAAWHRAPRPTVIFGLGAAALAALPGAALLLIGADLQKSRLLYLPSFGLAILLAGIADGVPARWARAAVAVALVFFQGAALRHNLAIWQEVSGLARTTCESARRLVDRSRPEVTVIGLPASIRGVYFFQTGFESCLEMAHGGIWKAHFLPPGAAPPPGGTVLVWHGDGGGRSLTVR